MIPERFVLKNTVKHPTSVLIGALDKLGLEIIESLLEQGGYVIVVDTYTQENVAKLEQFPKTSLISFIDYSNITFLEEEIRRLDYVFYFSHQSRDVLNQISSQQFLAFSNYLDAALSLAQKFEAKFLLTTSIKAHQFALANQEVGINYGVGTSTAHTVYTDMEVQRYAESLTIEYYTKKKLDARICRLGEIIGDGIDFLATSNFVDMVLMASQNQPILLKKDGLESDYYIHVLDAAYGLIKAQFSQNATGKIFSVAYEHAFTHLSLAYKIQEVHPDSREIQFADEKDNLPSIKLYKPAPNLSTIGWITRVPIEKAIKQSIAATKIYLLENETLLNKQNKQNPKSVKLQKFINIAKRSDSAILNESSGETTISKLLNERKRQEELRKNQLNLANARLKKSKSKIYSPREKWLNTVWNITHWLASKFDFLKNKTPAQIGFLTIMLVFFILTYLFVISPFIAISRNVLIINSTSDELFTKLESGQFFELESELSVLNLALQDVKHLMQRVEWCFYLVGLGDNILETTKFIDASQSYLTAIGYLNETLYPLKEFFGRLDDNLQLRSGAESYLGTTSPGTNLSPILQTIESNSSFFEIAKTTFQQSLTSMRDINYSKAFDGTNLNSIFQKLDATYNNNFLYFDFSYLPTLLGVDRERTYAILILDNLRPRPMGGDLSALALVTVNNGSITDIVLKSSVDVNFDFSDLTTDDFNAINLTKFTYKSQSDVAISDILNIIDEDYFSEISRKILSKTFSKGIDSVFTINLSTVVSLATQQDLEIFINANQIDEISSLVIAQDSNKSLLSRKRVIAEYSARVFEQTYANFQNLNFGSISLLRSGVQRNTVKGFNISGQLIDSMGFISNRDNVNSFVSIYFTADDPLFSAPDRLASLTTSFVSQISNTFQESNRLNLRIPNLGTTSEVAVCFPLSVPSASINIGNFAIQRNTINIHRDQKCSVFKVVSETDLQVSYQVENFVNPREDVYSFTTLFSKSAGLNHNADFSLTFSPQLQILSSQPTLEINGGSVQFTEILNNDKILNFRLRKL